MSNLTIKFSLLDLSKKVLLQETARGVRTAALQSIACPAGGGGEVPHPDLVGGGEVAHPCPGWWVGNSLGSTSSPIFLEILIKIWPNSRLAS